MLVRLQLKVVYRLSVSQGVAYCVVGMALRLGTMLAYNEEEKKEKLSLSSMKEKVGKQKYSKSYINAPIGKN